MSQNNVDFSGNPTGAGLMDDYLDKEQQNVLTSNSGIQRPSYAIAGTKWIDTSVTPWILKMYDGTDDVVIGTLDPSTHKFAAETPTTTQTTLNLSQTLDDSTTKYPSNAAVNTAMGVFTYDSSEAYALNDYVITYDDESKTVIYRSKVANNTAVLTDENSWEKVSLGGGGLEIGDIGFAPLGIDETQNKRRYLNGQVISQIQFASFTTKVKAAVALYPSLSATEENWQAEVTNSKLGQCGKFVIDDTAGTIRLPKVVNINGLQDLANIGKIKEESLPNITGHFAISATYGAGVKGTGVFTGTTLGGTTSSPNTGTKTGDLNLPFNAKNSSSVYQDGAPVQQEAVQYPYFIQVATGSEESVDVTREIELNNPFSLFDSKWADHELSNASWVKSNGTFYSGLTYVTAYNELLSEYNKTSSVEKTDGSITYKLTPKGFKIAIASQDAAVTALYNNTGVAWYYVLDTENTQFKLPRTKWGFVGIRNAAEGYVAESLPNISGDLNNTAYVDGTEARGAFSSVATGSHLAGTATATSAGAWHVKFSANGSSSVYKDGAPVQQRATEMYLYFYVGETIQDANIIYAANLIKNVYDLDSAAVHKAGKEVITGLKTFNADVLSTTLNDNSHYNMVVKCNDIDNTTAPTGTKPSWGGIEFQDKNGIRIAKVEIRHNANGIISAALSVSRVIDGNLKFRNISVHMDSSGYGWIENLRPNYDSLVGLGITLGTAKTMPNDGVLFINVRTGSQPGSQVQILDGSGNAIGVSQHNGGSAEYHTSTFTAIVSRRQSIKCSHNGKGTAAIVSSYLAPWR